MRLLPKGTGGPPYTPGCDCPSCVYWVCYFDSYCCDVEWDPICDGNAMELCDCCYGFDPGYCDVIDDDGSADVPATTDAGVLLMILLLLGGSGHLLLRRGG